MNKTSVLIILQDCVGGAERISVLFGKSLPRDLYEVKFCLVCRKCDTSIRDFIPKGYPILSIPCAGPVKVVWQLFRTIWKEHPYVVFSSVMYLNTKILPFRSIFPNTRFIVRCENYLYTFNSSQYRRIRMTYHRADAIIAQTKEMCDELINQLHISKEKVYVIQNPVDTELINKMVAKGENPYPNNGMKHFVASGRFAYQKGFDLLLEAFIEVAENRHDVDLYIVGDYSYKNGKVYRELMDRAKVAGVDHLLHCMGYQKNPYPYIQHADCFVLSSRWEGLPNVLIEALYLGTPAAALKCVPVVERIVQDGLTGFLAEKENVPELASAMNRALSLERIESFYQSDGLADFISVLERCILPYQHKEWGYLNIKNFIRRTWIYQLKKKWDKWRFARKRKPYLDTLQKLIGSNTSIISSNCFAGRIMQDLKMEYNSPTLGLWIMPDDFAVFCSDLQHYLKADIQIVEHSKNELGEYKMTHPPKHPYPVGLIDGKLEAHFLHYYTAEEAVSKWKRRAARVNLENLILIGSEQNGCTEDDIKTFDALPYPRKLYFCSKPYPYKSVVYIKEFEKLGHTGDPYKKGHIYYKYLVEWLNNNQ